MNGLYLATTNQSVYIPESKHHHGYTKLLQKLQRYVLISENSESIYKIQSSTKKLFLLLCYVDEVKEIQYLSIATGEEKVLSCPSPVVSKHLF